MEAVSTVLFEKYQLCGILGTGRTGTVFLAVHLGLEEYRAIKRVPKSFLSFEHFRHEALILKELRHPGIPIIYDVEEDELYNYLIEEYLEGDSLYDLVRKQGHLSRELTISYGFQLTSIITYLHLAGTNPILHLDLQPKNLLMCQDTIKLIDFGLAASPDDANIPGERYGTVGCAAPEQYKKDGVLDERTDIYAIGAILYYFFTGTFPEMPYKPVVSMDADLGAVIGQCLSITKEERFSSAQELGERLKKLMNPGTAAKDCLQSSSLTIALSGSKSGAGTTHIAVGLSVYLRNHGYPNLFDEKNNSGMGNALGTFADTKRDQYGLMRYRGFIWRPFYGAGVKLKEPGFSLRILDYGKEVKKALKERPDLIILVCDGCCWNRKEAQEAISRVLESKIQYGILINHLGEKDTFQFPEGVDFSRCMKVPYFSDPFHLDRKTDDFFKMMSGKVLERKELKKRSLTGLLKDGKKWMMKRLLK